MRGTDVFLDDFDDDLDGSLKDFDDIRSEGIRDPIPEPLPPLLLSLDALFVDEDACVPEDADDAMAASDSSADLRPDFDDEEADDDANCR